MHQSSGGRREMKGALELEIAGGLLLTVAHRMQIRRVVYDALRYRVAGGMLGG
jgi:hypothetical protein